MKRATLLLAVVVLCCGPRVLMAGMILTAEAPGVQSSQVSGVTTETFDGFSHGSGGEFYTSLNTVIGNLASPSPGLGIIQATLYGGAGGVGNYFAIGNGLSPEATLILNGPQAYFGFWWSAADPYNEVEFRSGGQLVASFNPGTALGELTDPGYYGNPNSAFLHQDGWEKFAYLNFYGTGGTTFDEIVFRNPGTASDFEADNFSVRATPVDTTSGTPLDGGVTVAAPEPPSFVLIATALPGLGGLVWLRRKGPKAITLAAITP